MAIYRFRVEIEDYEGIYREIEVKTTQTFEDLHYAVLRAFSFDLKHPSSFFYSDDLWHMEDEIAFKDMMYTMTSNALPANKTRISDYVDDPHQRFIFVYQSEEGWAFLIELVDIDTNDGGRGSLPATVKSVGEAPKQYNTKIVVKPAMEKEKPKLQPLRRNYWMYSTTKNLKQPMIWWFSKVLKPNATKAKPIILISTSIWTKM